MKKYDKLKINELFIFFFLINQDFSNKYRNGRITMTTMIDIPALNKLKLHAVMNRTPHPHG